MLESRAMDLKGIIEALSRDWGDRLGVLFPLLLFGLLGLYVLWLVIGYLRVSQVRVEEESHTVSPAVPVARSADGTPRPADGVPYCPVDGLQYPPGARFCTVCERDLVIDCPNCGTVLPASETACYRCGTRTAVASVPLLR
jgi:hypothetical protein